MICTQLGRKLVVALVLLTATSACAPGRSIVRGNWPDGRIETNSSRVTRRVPPRRSDQRKWSGSRPSRCLRPAPLI